MNAVTQAIIVMRDRFIAMGEAETLQDINAGLCEDFALDVIAELAKTGIEAIASASFDEGGHVWVTVEGRHYDAECAEGVSDWRKLPFFVRRTA